MKSRNFPLLFIIALGCSLLCACGKQSDSNEQADSKMLIRMKSPPLQIDSVLSSITTSDQGLDSTLKNIELISSSPINTGILTDLLTRCADSDKAYTGIRLACVVMLGRPDLPLSKERVDTISKFAYSADKQFVEAALWAIAQEPKLAPNFSSHDLYFSMMNRQELPAKLRVLLWQIFSQQGISEFDPNKRLRYQRVKNDEGLFPTIKLDNPLLAWAFYPQENRISLLHYLGLNPSF